jgi:hypothetical protein
MNGPMPTNVQLSPDSKQWLLSAFQQALCLIDDPSVAAGLSRARDIIAGLPERRACKECLHVNAYGKQYCEQWNADIPEDWLERGCDKWEPAIPF